MAITSGFYNSLNGDRKYTAEQMSAFFDGLITDGVFASIGEKLKTIPGEGMSVLVQSGRAWFSHTWVLNDSNYSLKIDAADPTLKRKDAIIIEIDHSTSGRIATFKVVRGTPSQDPQKPAVNSTSTLTRVPIAYVTIQNGSSVISGSDIEINVGRDQTCPYVAGVVQQVSAADIYSSWEREFHEDLTGWETEFTEWFSDIQSQLAGDVATNLLNQINEIKRDYLPKADKATAEDMTAGTNDSKYVTPKVLTEGGISSSTNAIRPVFENDENLMLYTLSEISIPRYGSYSAYQYWYENFGKKDLLFSSKYYTSTYNILNEEPIYTDEDLRNGAFTSITVSIPNSGGYVYVDDGSSTRYNTVMNEKYSKSLAIYFYISQRINQYPQAEIRTYVNDNDFDDSYSFHFNSTASVVVGWFSTMNPTYRIPSEINQHVMIFGVFGASASSYEFAAPFTCNLLSYPSSTGVSDKVIYDFDFDSRYIITLDKQQEIYKTLYSGFNDTPTSTDNDYLKYSSQNMFVTKKYIGWIIQVQRSSSIYKLVCVYFDRNSSGDVSTIKYIGNNTTSSVNYYTAHYSSVLPNGTLPVSSNAFRRFVGDDTVIMGNKVGILLNLKSDIGNSTFNMAITNSNSYISSGNMQATATIIPKNAVLFDLDAGTKSSTSQDVTIKITIDTPQSSNTMYYINYLSHDDRYLYYSIYLNNYDFKDFARKPLIKIDTTDWSISTPTISYTYDKTDRKTNPVASELWWTNTFVAYTTDKYICMLTSYGLLFYNKTDNTFAECIREDSFTTKLFTTYNPYIYSRPIDFVTVDQNSDENINLFITPNLYCPYSGTSEYLYNPKKNIYFKYTQDNVWCFAKPGSGKHPDNMNDYSKAIYLAADASPTRKLLFPYALPLSTKMLYVRDNPLDASYLSNYSSATFTPTFNSKYAFYRKEPLEIE